MGNHPHTPCLQIFLTGHLFLLEALKIFIDVTPVRYPLSAGLRPPGWWSDFREYLSIS